MGGWRKEESFSDYTVLYVSVDESTLEVIVLPLAQWKGRRKKSKCNDSTMVAISRDDPISVTRCWNQKKPKIDQTLPKGSHSRFYLIIVIFESSTKSHQTFRFLWKIWWHWELSKIAQSGHTGHPIHKVS